MYYILPKAALQDFLAADRFEALAHDIDDSSVILLARFRDHGQQFRFEQLAGVEPLPDPRSGKAISPAHAAKLAKYGVKPGNTALEVSDCLAVVAGHYMRLTS